MTAPRAIILAAGLGTRLGELSAERPKPMFPVAGYPLIRYAISLLARHGTTEIAINLHHRGDVIRGELGDGRAFGVELVYSEEPEILGTGGGLVRARDFLTRGGREPFFVINGKILIDLDLGELRGAHERADAEATMVVRDVPDAERWGAVYVEGTRADENAAADASAAARATAREARVVSILARGPHPSARACMFTGVHLVSPALLDRLPSHGVSDSIRQGYLPALAAGAPIAAHVLRGYFHEHSTPRRYLEGNWNVLQGRATGVVAPGPVAGVDPGAEISPSAKIVGPVRICAGAVVEDGATVGPFAVLCPDTLVEKGAVLERAVLWPGARARGVVRDAIVTTRGVFSSDHAGDSRDATR